MKGDPTTSVVFHIYINGKDVFSNKTSDASNETTENGSKNLVNAGADEVRECGFEQQRRGGGKKPPYYWKPPADGTDNDEDDYVETS